MLHPLTPDTACSSSSYKSLMYLGEEERETSDLVSEKLEDTVEHAASRERLAQLNKQNRVSDRNFDNEELDLVSGV